MNCPVCSNNLSNYNLIDDLSGFICGNCNGKWLSANEYINWGKKNYKKKNIKDSSKVNTNIENTVFNRKSIFEDNNNYRNIEKIELLEKNNQTVGIKEDDYNKAKICPECKHILIKYKLDIEKKINIEHCGICSGVWFDLNKWEFVVDNNLHFDLYEIFTEHSQRKIREKETKKYLDKKYNLKFGRLNYEKLKEIKQWIDCNENKTDMIGFILKKNPYKI